MACCLPTCAQRSSVSATELVGERRCLGTLGAPGGPAHLGCISFANSPSCMCKTQAVTISFWVEFGGSTCHRGSQEVHQITGKCAIFCGIITCSAGYCGELLLLLVLDSFAYVVIWNKGALRENCRQKHGKTCFSPFRSFLLCRNSLDRFWSVILWHLWIGRARNPGPQSLGVSVELFNSCSMSVVG